VIHREHFLNSNKPVEHILLLNLPQIEGEVELRIWPSRRVQSMTWRWVRGTDGAWREPPALTQGFF